MTVYHLDINTVEGILLGLSLCTKLFDILKQK